MHPLQTRPKTIAIVALGPTSEFFYRERSKKTNVVNFDEVWAVNTAANYLHCAKNFVMDDLRHIERQYPLWAGSLKTQKSPIITCKAYPEYPSSIAYPLDEVVKAMGGEDWLTTSVAYMLAYALAINVETVTMYGCDFFYPGSGAQESGAACVAFWIGVARGMKVLVRVPAGSTLLDAHLIKPDGKRYLYGYDFNPGESIERLKAGKPTHMDKLVIHGLPLQRIADAQKAAKAEVKGNA